jgi:hypothetical protein
MPGHVWIFVPNRDYDGRVAQVSLHSIVEEIKDIGANPGGISVPALLPVAVDLP